MAVINGDVNLCIGSTVTLAFFGVKLLSTMSQLYIGSAAKLLCFYMKTTKGNFKFCIGSVAKLLRNCSMDKMETLSSISFQLAESLGSFASKPL